MPTKDKYFEEYSALATLPLRDVVVYPHMGIAAVRRSS